MTISENKKISKSTLLLIIAIILGSVVVVWVIFYFDNQPAEQRGIGEGKIEKIMVASFPINDTLYSEI